MWKSVSWYTNGIQPNGFLFGGFILSSQSSMPSWSLSSVVTIQIANTSAVNWAIKTYSLRPLAESKLRIHIIIPIFLLRSSIHWLDLLTILGIYWSTLDLRPMASLVSQHPIFVRPCTVRPMVRLSVPTDRWRRRLINVTAQIFPDLCRPNNRVWAQTHLKVKAKRTPQFWGFSKPIGFWAGFLARRSVGDRVETSSNAMSGEFWDGLPFQKQLKLPSPTIWVLRGITEVELRLQLILLIHFNCHGEMTTTPGKPQAKPQYLTSSPLSKYNGYECKYTMKIVYAFQICTYSICYR